MIFIADKKSLTSLKIVSERISELSFSDLENYINNKDKLLFTSSIPLLLAYTLSFDEAQLDYVAIQSEYENQGYVSKAIKESEKILKEKGIKTIFLEVRKSNIKAINLYKGNNFVQYRERKNYYNFPLEDALCFRKDLEE